MFHSACEQALIIYNTRWFKSEAHRTNRCWLDHIPSVILICHKNSQLSVRFKRTIDDATNIWTWLTLPSIQSLLDQLASTRTLSLILLSKTTTNSVTLFRLRGQPNGNQSLIYSPMTTNILKNTQM